MLVLFMFVLTDATEIHTKGDLTEHLRTTRSDRNNEVDHFIKF
jgi:hypothetical protein